MKYFLLSGLTRCALRLVPSIWVARRGRVAWLVGLGCLAATSSPAQDLIVRSDNSRVEAQVLEVRGTQVFYKKWTERDGPVTILSTDYVQYIQYQNGSRTAFNPTPPPTAPLPAAGTNLGLNVVSIRPADLFFGNVTLAYERLLDRTNIGLKVPLSWGPGHRKTDNANSLAYFRFNQIASAGLEANFYLTPAQRFRYFVGPALQWGWFRYRRHQYKQGPSPYGPPLVTVLERVGQQVAIVVNGGVWQQLGKRLVLSADAGLGWQTTLIKEDYGYFDYTPNEGRLSFSGNLNLGYQF